MRGPVLLSPIADSEEREFLTMAVEYFTELNPEFVAREDWRNSYFSRLKNAPDIRLRWIQRDAERAGFAIYGVEGHRFLPRTSGCIYEFYVQPRFRRSGLGKKAAEAVLRELQELSPSKIQLEIAAGNVSGEKFWRALGFHKASERYVLDEGRK